MKNQTFRIGIIVASAGLLSFLGCEKANLCGEGAGNIKDEAMCVGRASESLSGADEDYFRDMDYGITKNPERVAAALSPFVPGISPEEAVKKVAKGRNNWIVWTAGNDRFWDDLAKRSVGTVDFLKTVSSHPSLKFSRDNRWKYLGLVNEPCFRKAEVADPERFGLWLDQRLEECPADPFEDQIKYPGVKIGARNNEGHLPVGSFYGYASGIVGLRLFPNPDFDKKALKNWDSERYYTDPAYYNDKDLVRPYRVGMSCGFCHVGPNPTNPPEDSENPKWENLNSNPGAQYFWIDKIFDWNADESSFPYQLFHTSRPGTLDTSLISSDYINNPRTMNAIYSLGARMKIALLLAQEKLEGGGLNNKQFNDYLPEGTLLTEFYKKPDTVWTPRILKDGSDSVGALGALNRVFVNIGLFSEEWLLHFRPLLGGKKISPIEIEVARKNSNYWNATEAQTPDLALFFLATAQPDYLENAPNSEKYLQDDEETLARGKEVFAERCARCHSSKLPKDIDKKFPRKDIGSDYLDLWNKYWAWTKTDEFKDEMRQIVLAGDFLEENFLSTELRVPVTLLETNACSPLATNAIEDNIWDNFSSQSYKDLPSVGAITVHHPYTGVPREYVMPSGGRGYTRPASLISLWSTAPYLLNNSVGEFDYFGSVDGRMKSFDDSIQKMLWPEKRKTNQKHKFMTASGKELPGFIDVTTAQSYLRVPAGFLPGFLKPLLGLGERFLPFFFDEGGIEIGPIPKGTPVNLLSNIDMDQKAKVFKLLLKIIKDLKALPKDASDAEARKVFANLLQPLIEVSKCPDFVVNRGHYFGTDYFREKDEPGLNDQDKWALIAFLKRL